MEEGGLAPLRATSRRGAGPPLADACRYRVWVGELLIAQQGHAVDIESGTCCDGVASEKWQEEEPKMRLTCWQRSLVLLLSELSLLRLARPMLSSVPYAIAY